MDDFQDDDTLTKVETGTAANNNNPMADDQQQPAAAEEEEDPYPSFLLFIYKKCCCKYLLPVFVLMGVIAAVMAGLGIQPTKDHIPFADFIFSRNGWKDVNAEDLPRWDTRGAVILKLEMLNELDDHWQSYFTKAIDEWNTGTPDVLELSVTRTQTPNADCDFVRGKFAICNGDYGASDFHGVNQLLVYEGEITASVTRLNEHYMRSASNARKQYTMCHEIGHGFGIPHADENFFNLNLGNCMDYTNRPWSNTAPDAHTFELLEKMYHVPEPDSTSTTWAEASYLSSSGGNLPTGNNENMDAFPDWITQRANEAATNLQATLAAGEANGNDGDVVQRHRDDNSASFQVELGDGYVLHAQFLLAN